MGASTVPVIAISDPADPRLDVYRDLTDAALRRRVDAEHGLYMAESDVVLARAVAAGHRPLSVLALTSRVDRVHAALGDADTTVFAVDAAVIASITGFDVHRGVLAAIMRPLERTPNDVLRDARTVLIAEDTVDHANLGALFRNAAALGADGVLLTPRAADPYYRRTVRVSMGTVFAVPWARLPDWTDAGPLLRGAGFEVVALALADDAIDLAAYMEAGRADRVALLVGSEGPGLTADALGAADRTVVIPMSRGVDSLNVATAAALALWALRQRPVTPPAA